MTKRNVTTLAALKKRGLCVEGFAEGYAARNAIMQAGEMVQAARIKAGLTQSDLAERVGMSESDISRLEAGLGNHGPSVETLSRLASACHRRLIFGLRD